jgi:hypothetical protein
LLLSCGDIKAGYEERVPIFEVFPVDVIADLLYQHYL